MGHQGQDLGRGTRMTSQNLQSAQQVNGSVGEDKRPIHHGGKKGGPRKVLMPKEKAKDLNLEEKRKSLEITRVKEIDDPKLEEIETHAVWEPYNFVRIIYNRQTNEYIYEAIEPELTPDEESTLEFLKTALIKTMDYHFDVVRSKRKDKIDYVRQCAMSVLSSINIRLEENVKERLMYYLLRDFVGYGIIDIQMTDEMVEDISCDGPKIPIFVYHKKYESMRSNIQFADDRQLDSFVISRSEEHTSELQSLS
jgi:flagellar protein FlaI